MLILENKSLIIIKYITKKPLKHSTCATPADSVCRPFENFCFVQKRWLIVVFFYGKKSMSPLTADDVFKNSTPKSFCQKKMFTVFLSKKVFSMNLFFVCMYPSNDICMEKSSQNINYSGALRTPKCVSPDSWKFWDIHNGVKYILIASNITRYFWSKKQNSLFHFKEVR